jgi:phosphoadenosine phosphosulfate reductase
VTAVPLFEPRALAEKSRAFEGRPPLEVLAWALAEYAPRLAISTAFGVEGCALIDMAVKIDPGVRVFTVDSEFLFPESRELMDRLVEKYRLDLTVLRGEVSRDEQERRHGLSLWARDTDQCCALRKVEPTRRALVGLDAWIAGLRRDQGPSRAGIQLLERYDHDDGTPLVKVQPLAAWTRNDTWRYVMENGVPYNPLLDRGYKSIGCWPCTRTAGEGGDERTGRWAGSGKSECGIHTFMERKVS